MARSRWAEAIGLCLILALAAYLRLANVADNPRWYTDEGTNLSVAQSLAEGRMQYLAITQSTLLFSRLVVFENALALLLKLTAGGIEVLRAFTGLLGALSIGLLWWIVRRIYSRQLAMLSTVIFAIYPPAILYSRFGFSYNLLTPLVLIAYLGAWEYLQRDAPRRWLVLSAIAIGTGTISDLWMLVMIAPLAIVVLIRNRRDLLWCIPLVLAPFLVYSAIMLLTVPNAFLFDLSFVFFRLNQLPLQEQLNTLALNYTILVAQDSWMLLGLIGLFVLRDRNGARGSAGSSLREAERRSNLKDGAATRLLRSARNDRWARSFSSQQLALLSLLFFLLPIVFLGRTNALYSLTFYYMIPLLPFVCLGVAAFIEVAASHVLRIVREMFVGRALRVGAYVIVALLIVTPFIISTLLSLNQITDRFQTAIDPFLIDPAAARQVAAYINGHLEPDDVVIASPALAWLLHANVADFQMSLASSGQATVHIPAGLPADRFAFDADYRHARFVVIDNLWRNWAVYNIAGVSEMMHDVSHWPLVFESGEIVIHQNLR